jgi:hypothetical protein
VADQTNISPAIEDYAKALYALETAIAEKLNHPKTDPHEVRPERQSRWTVVTRSATAWLNG